MMFLAKFTGVIWELSDKKKIKKGKGIKMRDKS